MIRKRRGNEDNEIEKEQTLVKKHKQNAITLYIERKRKKFSNEA